MGPAATDPDGFDAERDTVGAGIYGGGVKRDVAGRIVIGRQYQNHNRAPGPVYAGLGYTAMVLALSRGPAAIDAVLARDPAAINEISTGGATPLHMCGMSEANQLSTAHVIARGGDIEAVDTYAYRPLHRMASNDLAIGARALLEAGADPNARGAGGARPMRVATEARAVGVIKALREHGGTM